MGPWPHPAAEAIKAQLSLPLEMKVGQGHRRMESYRKLPGPRLTGVLLTPLPCDFEPVHSQARASTSYLQDPSDIGLLNIKFIVIFVSKTVSSYIVQDGLELHL